MTADEIRKHLNAQEIATCGPHVREIFTPLALVEIAAQLAELNAKLDRIIGQVGPTADGVFVGVIGSKP